MKTWRQKITAISAISSTVFVLCFVSFAYAQQSSSNNYKVNEVIFGTGGQDYCPGLTGETSPGTYCALVTAGELTIGNTKSDQFQAYGGFNSERSPFIEAVILQPYVDLGVVGTDKTGFGTAEFQVKAYLAHGYSVQIYGPPPTNGGHAISPMATTSAPTFGVEQFGLNLVANSMVLKTGDPVTNFGAGAQQDLDGTFSSGYVNNNVGANMVYDSANNFKYQSGDVIARANASTSYTKYTMSYVMNASPITPGGTYTTNQSIVATGTF